MKLSDRTLTVLKNFSTINNSLYVDQGKLQRSWNGDETILVEAVLDDEFEMGFGIYDLPQFLGNVSTMSNPELKFEETHVILDDGKISLDYFYCSPNLIKSPPKKPLNISNPDVQFELEQASFQKLLKLASLNSLPILTIIGSSGKLKLKTHEKGSHGSNNASMDIGEYSGPDFSASFSIDNLKMLPDDYTVIVNLAGFALFKNKDETLKYFVALEKK